jgi:WD40 repeat protein
MVKLWNAETSELTKTFSGHRSTVEGLVFPNNDRLVSAGWDTEIRIWDLKSGDCEAIMDGHDNIVRDVDLSPDNRLLVSVGSNEGLLLLWDFRTRTVIRELERRPTPLWRAKFSAAKPATGQPSGFARKVLSRCDAGCHRASSVRKANRNRI